jgi:hypothetical protein
VSNEAPRKRKSHLLQPLNHRHHKLALLYPPNNLAGVQDARLVAEMVRVPFRLPLVEAAIRVAGSVASGLQDPGGGGAVAAEMVRGEGVAIAAAVGV